MRQKLAHALDWLGRHDWMILVALLLIVGGVWGFAELADEVREGDTQTFDEAVVRALRDPQDEARPLGPTWMHEVGRDLTALGGVSVLLLLTGLVTGFLLLARHYRTAAIIAAATLGGLVISTALKSFFDRPRPVIEQDLAQVYTSSFPSGHSMMTAVVYFTLGALLAEMVAHRRQKVFVLLAALLLAALVGLSRIYLGVHYPTDVLAGWTAGLTWAILCWGGARARALAQWRRRGRGEAQDPPDPDDADERTGAAA